MVIETTPHPAIVTPHEPSRLAIWRRRPRRRVVLAHGVRIGRRVSIVSDPGGQIEIAAAVLLGAGVRLHAAKGARLRIGPGVRIGENARIEAYGGLLEIGRGTLLDASASLAGSVTVGERCRIGAWARVQGTARLDDDVAISFHAVVGSEVQIPSGASVDAYAVLERCREPTTESP